MTSVGMISSRCKMERASSIPQWTTVVLAKEFAVRGTGGSRGWNEVDLPTRLDFSASCQPALARGHSKHTYVNSGRDRW